MNELNDLALTNLGANSEQAQPLEENKNRVTRWRRWKRRLLFILVLIGIFAVMLSAVYLNRVSIFRSMGHFLHYQSELKKADVIIVLSGGGSIRLEKGIELFKQGLAPEMMLTIPDDIPPKSPGYDGLVKETRIYKAVLNLRNVPMEAVQWSDKVFYSTYGEGLYLENWLLKQGYDSAIVVTGYFQARRALFTMNHIFEDHPEIEIMIAPSESENFDADNWWENENGLIYVENEYMKFLYYYLKTFVGTP